MDAVYFALVAAGMGALWWRHLRQHQPRTRALGTVFDGDAEVVLHVAAHEARTRGEPMSSLHVLYGLLQDEQIATALRDTGSDPSALEDKVLAALDRRTDRDPERDDADVHRVYGHAAGHASHAGRRATAIDLWAYLRGSDAAGVVEDATIAAVLLRLCHGSELETASLNSVDVHVVLRNDHYSTAQFVAHLLETVFELTSEQANARMLEAHNEGRAVIGRYRAAEARAKIDEARARARAAGFPLWIGYEPA